MSGEDRNLLQRAAHFLVDVLKWTGDSLTSEKARRAILADLGLNPTRVPPLAIPQGSVNSIDRYRQQTDVDFEAFLSAWGDVVTVVEAIEAFLVAAGAGNKKTEAAYQLLNLMATEYTRLRYPLVFFGARLLNVVFGSPPGHLNPLFSALDSEENFAKLPSITLLPTAILLAYLEKIGRRVGLIGPEFSLPERTLLYGWDETPGSSTPVADRLSRGMLSFAFVGQVTEPTEATETAETSLTGKLGLTLGWVPPTHGGPGLFVAPQGSGTIKAPLADDWALSVKFASTAPVDFLISDGVEVSGDANASAGFTIETTRKADAPPMVLSVLGTRLEIGKFSIQAQLGADGASIKAVARNSALVLGLSDGDAFVERAIPSKEVRFEFNLGLGVASGRGVFLEGGTGLQLARPLNRNVGPMRLRQLFMALDAGRSGSGLRLEVSLAIELHLGAVTVTLDRVGFLAAYDPGDREPPQIGYKGPNGVGLLIDSEGVVGAGYLFFDRAQNLYAGAVQLDLKCFTLQAVGLITTRMPDDKRGYSLLVIVSAGDVGPWNLGYGFRLVAVGGLVGLNRSANVDALRAGLKTGALDAILFPPNPVANAPRLVSTLQSVMPPREGQFLFGLTARIVWGVPTILTIDLGLVLEWSSPTRLLVLGQFRALLPSEDRVLVRLQMDALGVIDLDRGELAVDATLYDSRILAYILTGDMALRARWSGDPTFLLAVGGFHPGFRPPAQFPQLERTALTLNKGGARLRLESYFALTSNTAQFGARLDVVVRAGGFSLDGHLGFDALFRFSPFQFIAEIEAGVTLKWHGRTLLGVELELLLSGPTPWHAHGTATFSVWIFSVSVGFDRTFGADEPSPALSPVDPRPELIEALSNVRNWSAQLPPDVSTLVTLRELSGTTEVLVHPFGEISVRQRVVPLGITIDRYGNTSRAGERRFNIEFMGLEDRRHGAVEPVLDYFAASQFLDLSDADKLRRPSFELMEAGSRIGGALSFGGEDNLALMGVAAIEYESVIVGAEQDVRAVTPLEIDPQELRAVMSLDARHSPLQRSGRAKYRAPKHDIALAERRYVIASTRDLKPVTLPGLERGAPSYTAAAQALRQHVEKQLTLHDELQVIRTFVAEGAMN